MTVFAVLLVQELPMRSETIYNLYLTQEMADDAAGALEFQLPKNVTVDVEPFEVIDEADYELG